MEDAGKLKSALEMLFYAQVTDSEGFVRFVDDCVEAWVYTEVATAIDSARAGAVTVKAGEL